MVNDPEVTKALAALGITEDDFYREADREIEAELDKTAAAVADDWRARSPVATTGDQIGEYQSDVRVSKIKDKDGRPCRRVGDYAPFAHIIEYGSEFQQPQGIRAQVATAFGNEGKYLV
jgi:hypothetical protein